MSSVTANIQRFWSSAVEPPDLASWWSSCVVSGDPTESQDLLAALRLDQQFRWRTSQPWLVEDYLASLPQLPPGVNWRMELAVGEWHARPAGQPLSPQDLQTRFPELPDLPAHLVTFPENADTLLLIDRVCDRLEELHRSRAVRPRLEFCLANLPLHCRQDGFCSLLTAELECLQGQAETLQSQSWLDRFPAYREQIVRVFAELSPRDESPPTGTLQRQSKTNVIPEDFRNVKKSEDGGKSERKQAEDIFRKYLKPTKRPLSIGRLGHYEVEEILGRGAFGIVARSLDEKLYRVVAIKLMRPDLAETSAPRKRFLREARAAAAVNHENIVAIYAVEEEPIPFLVMEFVPGGTLEQLLIKTGPLEIKNVLRIGQQIASGLAAAHAVQLIHRDIKPANILVSDESVERVKISDFGLARAVDDASLTQSGLILGTAMYMAPEQARGETLDHRADLFSLGCVLYEAICGRPPFRAPSTFAVLKRVCEDTPRSLNDVLPGIPGWLEKIVFRLLSKQKEDRYQTAQEVADLLGRCRLELEHNEVVTCVDVKPDKTEAKQSHESLSRESQGNVDVKPHGVLTTQMHGSHGIGKKRLHQIGIGILGCLFAIAMVYRFWFPSQVIESPVSALVPVGLDTPVVKSTPTANLPQVGAPSPAVAPFDTASAGMHQDAWAQFLNLPVQYENTFGMKFRLVPPGEFQSGSTEDEIFAALDEAKKEPDWHQFIKSEGPQQKVIITRPLYFGVTEVTEKQFDEVMRRSGENRERDSQSGSGDRPVLNVSWNDAVRFCVNLSVSEKLEPAYEMDGDLVRPRVGVGYRLPTECEWEYACRAGTTTVYSCGDSQNDLMKAAWFSRTSGGLPHPGGELRANPFGLYDMHGNAWEWVQDGWHPNSRAKLMENDVTDPQYSFEHVTHRVIRGGHCSNLDWMCRSASRLATIAGENHSLISIRLVLVPEAIQARIR